MTDTTHLKRPEYDPATGLTRFEWILRTSQALRERQAERLAAEVQRINDRARTHGDQA